MPGSTITCDPKAGGFDGSKLGNFMARQTSPAFGFYVKDFLVGVSPLSLAERGAYITFLAYEWDAGSVPADPAARARVLGCSRREADAVWAVIAPKFVQNADGTWCNPRLEDERSKQAERRAQLSANGLKGGRPRKPEGLPNVNQKVNQTETKRFSEPEPENNQIKSLSSSSSISSSNTSTYTQKFAPRIPNDSLEPQELYNRAGALLNRYKELFYLHRKGARYHDRMHLDFEKALGLVRTWEDDGRLEKLAVIVLTTDDDWISSTDRGFGVFASRASWADDRLVAWESKHQVSA
jgi:uncharacterized protein YdaU (DUF1376 family)